MIKLVASDIDGTLLVAGKKELSPEIYDIILELKRENITFVAASGRQLESLRKLFGPIENDIFYVAENGAVVKCGGEPIVLHEFEHALAMRIIRELENFPDCKMAVSTPTTQYILGNDDKLYDFMVNHVKYHTTVVDSFENIRGPIIKIAFMNSEAYEERYEYFKTLFQNEIRVAKAGNSWVDFIPFQSDKGTGLKFILDKLHLSKDEVVSFGDEQNDIEMLGYTGRSYAMEYAKIDVKKCATDITNSVEQTLKELLNDTKQRR